MQASPGALRLLGGFALSFRQRTIVGPEWSRRRAAAVRELLRRGLTAEGFSLAGMGQKSQSFGVLPEDQAEPRPDGNGRADSG